MDAQKAQAYRQQLIAARESLLQQLELQRGGQTRAESAAAHFGHAEDAQAQVYTEREMELTLDDRETQELEAIRAALQRIDEGVYGQCVDCGVDIAPGRLHAAPEAARCIVCQEQVERAGHA